MTPLTLKKCRLASFLLSACSKYEKKHKIANGKDT
jgi:hypothetical protein